MGVDPIQLSSENKKKKIYHVSATINIATNPRYAGKIFKNTFVWHKTGFLSTKTLLSSFVTKLSNRHGRFLIGFPTRYSQTKNIDFVGFYAQVILSFPMKIQSIGKYCLLVTTGP